ncbi:MAG TPA: tetratricopeptide repeat protein [Candidatus Krumholzibacteria bacterium]|nr:tetratricopeptide repeat protein [Candidatus Krumholzibacteria bacterium]
MTSAVHRFLPAVLPVLLALAVYGGAGRLGFVNLDDDQYVYENPRVLGGLTGDDVRWALTTGHQGVWIPATWISLQADAARGQGAPAAFHRTNLLLHLVNVLLVFALVRSLTGGRWRAAAVAAVFAVHPLNVEAVAWITARKDLLMAGWSLAAILCWRLADARWTRPWAWAALACAVVALASKPQAVALPVAMVLAAGWRDDDRWTWRALGRDVLAVLPFFALAAGAAVTAVKLAHGEAFGAITPVPFGERFADGVGFLWRHVVKLAYPSPLAPVYPVAHLHTAPAWAGALAFLAFSIGRQAVVMRRRWPALAFGWLWFVAWIIPTLGLVQGGQLPMGDRYTYVAMIGILVVVADAGAAAMNRRRATAAPLAILLVVVVVLGGWQARRQLAWWKDPVSLWTHTLAVTRDNALAHQNLAVVLDEQGRSAEALGHLEAALAIRPQSRTHYNAGNALLNLGRSAEAEEQYRQALALNPGLVEAALNLGSLLGAQGRLDEARTVLRQAEQRAPDFAPLQFNLGLVAWLAGDTAEARARCERTLALDPSHAKARELLGQLPPR